MARPVGGDGNWEIIGMRGTFSLFNSKAAGLINALHKSLAIIEFDPKGKILWANNYLFA